MAVKYALGGGANLHFLAGDLVLGRDDGELRQVASRWRCPAMPVKIPPQMIVVSRMV